jgi:hypothetical protein
MFQRFTERARRVIFFARYEASQFSAANIEGEHLLLGIMREDCGLSRDLHLAPEAPEAIRKRVEEAVAARPKVTAPIEVPFSQAAKIVLARAAEEADRLNHAQVAPAHLLLGLLRDEESLAAEILKSHGIGLAQVRELLAKQPVHWTLPPPPPPPGSPSPSRSQAESGRMEFVSLGVLPAIYRAGTLRLAELVSNGPKSADELATATRSDPQSLHQLLKALATYGLVDEVKPGSFVINSLGQRMIADSPATGGHLEVAEPTPAQSAEAFHRSILTISAWVTHTILAAYDFSPFHLIVDVGGGQGAFLAAMLGAAPAAKGVLLDALPPASGLADRIESIAGNYFEAVPPGGDLYTLKTILREWPDAECLTILRNIREVIAPGGKVILIEVVLGSGPDAAAENLMDLSRTFMTAGHERTVRNFWDLLEKAGFKFSRVIATGSPVSLIEATPE